MIESKVSLTAYLNERISDDSDPEPLTNNSGPLYIIILLADKYIHGLHIFKLIVF